MMTPKQLERHFKGVANHRRIEILFLISNNPGITLDDITARLRCNLKTIGEHTRKLFIAGLIKKKYRGRAVAHNISPYGEIFLKFISDFSESAKI